MMIRPQQRFSPWQRTLRAGWLIGLDLFLISLVLGALAAGLWFGVLKQRFEHQQVITLALSDANALPVGAPVRFMGVRIGLVKRIRLVDGQVEALLKLWPQAPQLPERAVASIQSFGLAGGKSLDFDLPPIDRDLRTLYRDEPHPVEPTVRLKDSFQAQIDLANSIKEGALLTYALLERYPPETLQSTFRALPGQTQQLETLLLQSQARLEAADEQLQTQTQQLKTLALQLNQLGNQASQATVLRQAHQQLHALSNVLPNKQGRWLNQQAAQTALDWRQQTGGWLAAVEPRATGVLPTSPSSVPQSLDLLQSRLLLVQTQLQQAQAQVDKVDLQQLHQRFETLNQQLQSLSPAEQGPSKASGDSQATHP